MEFEKIRDIIVKILNINPEEVEENTHFVDDLGADSLDLFQILMGIEEEFEIEIPDSVAAKVETVGDAVRALKVSK